MMQYDEPPQGQEQRPCELCQPQEGTEHHVLRVFREAHGGQLIDLALIYGGLEGESEVIWSPLASKAA